MKRKDRGYWNSISSPYDGGRYVDYRGYVHFRFIDESGKKVDKLEHRMNMEYTLSRKLFTTEMVHHINGRPSDNREENLILMTRRQHSHLHAKTHPWKTGVWT
jgi:hypothetical protein